MFRALHSFNTGLQSTKILVVLLCCALLFTPAMAQQTEETIELTASTSTQSSETEQESSSEEQSTESTEITADAEVATPDLTAEENLALEALIVVLSNESMRETLLERLQTPALAQTTEAEAAEEVTTTPLQTMAAETTQFAENFYDGLTGFWRDASAIPFVFQSNSDEKRLRISVAAQSLLVALIATFAVAWITRKIFTAAIANYDRQAPSALINTDLAQLLVEALADIISVLIAFAAGYGVAIALSASSTLTIEQSLFLNAFLIAGLANAGLSMLVHNSRADISIFEFSQTVEASIYNRLIGILSFCIYGLVFVVPVINIWANFATGRALRITIVTIAAVLALISIRQIANITKQAIVGQNAQKQLDEFDSQADSSSTSVLNTQEVGFIQYIWPTLATIYVLTVWIVSIAQPHLIVSLIGMGSAKILGVIVALTVGTRLLRGLANLSLPIPNRIDRIVPDFKIRLEKFLPFLSNILIVILCAAALFVLADGLGLLDLSALLTNADVLSLIGNVAMALIIVIASMLIWSFVSAFIDERLTRELPPNSDESRKRTLLALFKNAFTIVVLVFAVTMGLSQIGIDIAPLLAGAGVVGLAVGFGAQSLVQDVITGIFIQVENAINVGDVVTVGSITGGVEKLTVRSVGLRDLQGTYHIVPFSAVDTVSNFNRSFAYHVAELGVGYGEDIGAVKQAMRDAFDELKSGELGVHIFGDFEMHGVTELGDSAVTVRGRVKTRPGQQWGVGREYTEIVKRIFDARAIDIPYPHRTIVYPEPPASAESKTVLSTPPKNNRLPTSTSDTNDDS